MKLHKNILKAVSFLAILVLVSCGKPEEKSGSVSNPTDPTNTGGTPIPTPTPTGTPGVPDLTGALAINLSNGITDLNEVMSPWNTFVIPPLVGDPKALFQLSAANQVSVTGNITFAIEDTYGLWALTLNSFPNTSSHSTTAMDVIFASDELVVRSVGVMSGVNATDVGIYYRLRDSADTDNGHCRTQQTTTTTCHCELTSFNPNPSTEDYTACYAPVAGHNANMYYPYSAKKVCTTSAPTTSYTSCSGSSGGYMDLTNAKVKKLGSVQGKVF